MLIALALTIVASTIAGILFVLSTIFRTAMLPLRLWFVNEDNQKDFLIKQLIQTSFDRHQLDTQLKRYEKPRGRHRKIIDHQTKLITMLQERGWWTAKTRSVVAHRYRELTDAWDRNITWVDYHGKGPDDPELDTITTDAPRDGVRS
jgi:hypothetical protein